MIIDTDVLIWFLRGNQKAIDFIVDATPFSISIVTYMELVRGMRDKRELEKMKKGILGNGSRNHSVVRKYLPACFGLC